MIDPHGLRRTARVVLTLLAATMALAAADPATRMAGLGLSSTAIVIMLAPPRRDPAGAAAVATEPWPGDAGAPGGLVPLMPRVGLRLPTTLPVRRRPPPASKRFPRGTARAVGLVLLAFAMAVAVLQPQVRLDCLNLLPAFGGSDTCSWNTTLTREGLAALSALVLSITYAAITLQRRGRPGPQG